MADEKQSVDIFILDNKLIDRQGYINMLTSNRTNSQPLELEVVTDVGKRDAVCSTPARVIILSYMLCHKEHSGEIRICNGHKDFFTGLDIAESIRQWEDGSKYYIHIVSSEAAKEKPAFSKLTWNELVENGTIDSYSTRDPDEFVEHISKLVEAVENRK
jgi:hypothetical protein